MNRILLVFVLLFSFGLSINAQKKGPDCGAGKQFCDGYCRPAADCNRKNPPPPPPGLPLDTHIFFLLVAGSGLGMYFLGFQKKEARPLKDSQK